MAWFSVGEPKPLGKCAVIEAFCEVVLCQGNFAKGLPLTCDERAQVYVLSGNPKTGWAIGAVVTRKLKIEPADSPNSGKRWMLSYAWMNWRCALTSLPAWRPEGSVPLASNPRDALECVV